MKKLSLLFAALCICILTACGSAEENAAADLTVTGQMELIYAQQFSVDRCEGGYSVIHIAGDDFLLVPENADIPDHPEDMTVLRQPLAPIYLAASSAMDLFDAAGALELVKMTSTDLNSWALPSVRQALGDGSMTYIGKYSSPDYELLAESGCGLAIESTMIYHSPAVKEQIETLGIPVMVERSSYEAHPLGRMEWIKLYGLLTGNEDEAQEFFEGKIQSLASLDTDNIPDEDRKTAAFFSLSSNGYVTIRKPGDYISQMISLAGGKYIFTADRLNVDDNALATMNIQLEEFYGTAKDADILIYNSTIEGGLETTEQLLQKSGIFADFRAVQNGNVWCTEQNMFQQTTGAADMITELNKIFTAETDDGFRYLHKLK